MSKRPSSHLFDLIHSLTGAERKYYKLVAKNGKNEFPASLKLFENIERQEVFNDEALFASVKKAIANRNSYRVAKSALYDQVLKVMRQYQALATAIDDQLTNDLRDIRFLLSKRLISQAQPILNEAKEKAHTFQRYFHYLELLDCEFDILSKSESPAKIKQCNDALLDEARRASLAPLQRFKMLNLELKSFAIIWEQNFEEGPASQKIATLKDILNADVFKPEVRDQFLEIDLAHFEIENLYLQKKAFAGKHPIDWNEYFKKYEAFIEKTKDAGTFSLLQSFQRRYFRLLSNLLRFGNNITINALQKALALYGQARYSESFLNNERLALTYYMRLRIVYVTGKESAFDTTVDKYEPQLKRVERIISFERRLLVYAQKSQCFLMFYRFKECEKSIKLYLQLAQRAKDLRVDMEKICHFKFALIQTETGNKIKLRKGIKQLDEYFLLHPEMHEPEKILMNYFKKYLTIKTRSAEQKIIEETIFKLEKTTGSENFEILKTHFDFLLWFKSKLYKNPKAKFIEFIRAENNANLV